tara:strand:+ start:2662 stop:3222 length:561 start_codon:yes stop_codon:yes gene_type:complete
MLVKASGGFRSYRLFWVVALVVLVLDQGTKLWIDAILPFGTYFASEYAGEASPIVVIPGFFQIVHIGNEGAAWGMFSGFRFALVIVGVAALAGIYFFRGSLELRRPVMQFGFGLIVGGIVGNLIDRVLYGYVVDFLDFTLPGIPGLGLDPYRWPAFNVADMGISCGVFFYLLVCFFPVKKKAPESS